MKPSLQDTINQISAGDTVTFREPWYHRLFYVLGSLGLAGGGYVAMRLDFTAGWLFLILGGLCVLVSPFMIFRARTAIDLDRAGLTVLPDGKRHRWSEISNFFVSSGEVGDRWLSFRTVSDDPESAGDPARNQDLNSSLGFQPKALAELLNALRAEFADSQDEG